MRKTNVEFVKELMEYSPYGAMNQMVILHAIEAYAKQVATMPLDDFIKQWNIGMISPEAWHGTCAYITKEMAARNA